MILLAVPNAWEWFHDIALERTAAAVTDAVFVLIGICVIVASLSCRGKKVIQNR